MPISERRPRLAIAATALLACGCFITPASARHSDIPDLPPAPPSTAALAVAAMQIEVTAFQTTAAALLIDPSPQPLVASAAMASQRLDLIAAAAVNELASRAAQPWEFAAVLGARTWAQDQISSGWCCEWTLGLSPPTTSQSRHSDVRASPGTPASKPGSTSRAAERIPNRR